MPDYAAFLLGWVLGMTMCMFIFIITDRYL